MAQAIRSIAGDFEVNRSILGDRFGSFEVESRHGQSIGEILERHLQRDVLAQPLPTDDHRLPCPSPGLLATGPIRQTPLFATA